METAKNAEKQSITPERRRRTLPFLVDRRWAASYDDDVVATKKEAPEIAAEARPHLQETDEQRLLGVCVYGSATRGQLLADSDINITVILDRIATRLQERSQTSKLGSDISLDHKAAVLFFFAEREEPEEGRFAIHRARKNEGFRA